MLYDISEVCRIFGLTPSGVRYYEEQGLIHPERTSGGRRKYGMEEMRMLMHIKGLRACGLSLTEIGGAFLNTSSISMTEAQQYYQTALLDVERQIAVLQASRAIIEKYIEKFNHREQEQTILKSVHVSPIYMLHLNPLFGSNAQEQSALSEWIKLVPSVRKMTEYVLDDGVLQSKRDCFCVHQHIADELELPLREAAYALPAQAAIKLNYRTPHRGSRGFGEEDLETIMTVVRAQQPDWHHVRVIAAFLFGHVENERPQKHYEVWVMPA